MRLSNQLKNQHLLWRAAFGPMIENVNQLPGLSQKEVYKTLMKTSSKKPTLLSVTSNTMDAMVKDVMDKGAVGKLSTEQKRQFRKQSVDDIKNLNLAWMSEMINSDAQLREKMSLFWHGHFACRIVNIFYQQQLLDVIRQNALGKFGDLLREVSKTPAMLSFLNNQQNKKQHANENFAREVMELFTMGRGNYTENDVKEGARSFTGWGFNAKGEFQERPFVHDDGKKTFLGKTGNFTGDDIIDIILQQKATANFITKKIYQYFVNDEVDQVKVDKLAEGLFQSNYDLQLLMNNIFLSDWFYEEKNIGTRIKSPVEMMVGLRRLIPMKLEKPEAQLLFQKVLGQVLFYPPNVAGWPGGKNWIDSSALVFRMRLPQIFTNAESFLITPKSDDDIMMGKEGVEKVGKPNQLKVEVDWDAVVKTFNSIKKEDLQQSLTRIVLQSQNSINPNVLKKYFDNTSREGFIKTTMIELMSTPEYQLC